MGAQLSFTSSSIVFLLFSLSLSSIYYICHAHYSPNSENQPSPFHFNIKRPIDKTIKRPGCGVCDFHSHVSLASFLHNVTNEGSFFDFVPGVRWPHGKTRLSYSYPRHFRQDAHGPISKAMETWERATPFKFEFTNDFENADVKISFERGDHGDNCPFYGLPNEGLAHSFLPSVPTRREIHFNDHVGWQTQGQPYARLGAYDLQSVALHELGHILGLCHSNHPNAVMYEDIRPGEVRRELTDDDIRGFEALYPEY